MPPSAHSDRSPVVFFVDDEAGIRHVANRLLRKRGLMDIHLPDGWGAIVAQRLVNARPDMAVVYTTGLAEIDPILSGGLAGAQFVIRKPFTGDQLADTLSRAIAAKRPTEATG